MILAELSQEEIATRLRRGSLLIMVGPLLVRVQAESADFLATFQLLYANTTVLAPGSAVADLVMQLRRLDKINFHWTYDGVPSDRPFLQGLEFAHFEWAMHLAISGALLPLTSVHAAVAARDDGSAVALVGRSGSGKSTLLAGLVTSGWRLVADEFLILRADGGIAPMPSVITLKRGSIDLVKQFAPNVQFGPVMIDQDRGAVSHFVAPRIVEDGSDIRIRAIAFPYYRGEEEPMIVQLSRGETILRLAEQSHNIHLIGTDGFLALAKLAHAPAAAIRYTTMAEAIASIDTVMSLA